MQIISTIEGMRTVLDEHRQTGCSIGFVPTMGYLHLGHMTLVGRARAENDIVVASIFVNPLQFGENEDFSKYPRDIERDSSMLEAGGVDILFAPSVTDMYPRPMETIVDVPTIGAELEGEVRPGHFAGVCTVVTKLFNIIGPTRAYFGQKDYQQLQIIRRMVDDLAQPVDVVAVETVREADGLACSSRNVYLDSAERAAAAIVPRALEEAGKLVAGGETDPKRLESIIRAFIEREPLANPELVALRDAETLKRIGAIGEKPALLLLIVRFGRTRLLDNRILNTP